jgi:hypothetical protein
MPEKNPVPIRIPQQQRTTSSTHHSGSEADDFVRREVIAYLTRVKAGLERSRRQD